MKQSGRATGTTAADVAPHAGAWIETFPAYEETGVQARKAQVERHRERELEARRAKLKERLTACLNS